MSMGLRIPTYKKEFPEQSFSGGLRRVILRKGGRYDGGVKWIVNTFQDVLKESPPPKKVQVGRLYNPNPAYTHSKKMG